jgi:hypothetical protein
MTVEGTNDRGLQWDVVSLKPFDNAKLHIRSLLDDNNCKVISPAPDSVLLAVPDAAQGHRGYTKVGCDIMLGHSFYDLGELFK